MSRLSRFVPRMAEQLKSITFLFSSSVRLLLNDCLQYSRVCIVYGSYAKGLQTSSSDVDLLCIDADKKMIKQMIERYPFQVQLDCVTFTQFQEKQHEALAQEIRSYHMIFGDVSSVVGLWIGTGKQ